MSPPEAVATAAEAVTGALDYISALVMATEGTRHAALSGDDLAVLLDPIRVRLQDAQQQLRL